jgi:serine/threonine-protein kinase HipA
MNLPDAGEDRLQVLLNDTPVGELRRSSEGSTFRLADDYLEMPDRPVLGQVFEDAPNEDYWVRQGVAPWFSNLLPEGPLRDIVSARAGVHPTRAFFLLQMLGEDLPGAVVIRSQRALNTSPEAEPGSEEPYDDDAPLKFSLAGVQLKFSALRRDRGLTIPAEGMGGDWIVKLPDQRYEGVPENEYATMRWASESGIAIPDVDLIDVAKIEGLPHEVEALGGQAFLIRRFDRGPEARTHIEDFAQVLNKPPSQKYGSANSETIARVLAAATPPEDVDQFVRRLVFQVLAGNGDAHLKNWSLTYPDDRRPRLSPAYDLLCTVAYIPDDKLGLKLGDRQEFEEVGELVFRRFAERARLEPDRVQDIVRSQVAHTLDAWERIRTSAWVPSSLRELIDKRLGELVLARAGQ